MPTQSRHLRQRIFTISTNAGAYASIDKRTMLSGGAGRGGEEPDRRVGHVQGSGHKAQLQRYIAKRYGKDRHTVASWTEGRGRAAPRRARRQGGPRSTRTSRRWRQGAAAGSHQEGHPRVAAAQVSRRGPGRPTTPSPSSCARTASPSGRPGGPEPHLRFETPPGLCSCSSTGRVRQDGEPRRRAVRVQRVRGDAGPFPAGTCSSVEDQDDRRPGQVHVRHDREARRRAARVGHGQHVRPGDGQGRQAPQGPARIRVRQGRRLRAEAVPPAQPPDEGQHRVVEPLPVAAHGLPGRLRRLGRHRRSSRGSRTPATPSPTRPRGCLPPRCSWRREGRAAARRQPARPRGGDGRRGARGQGAGHDAGERARRAHVGAFRRCIGRPARIVCMPGGAMDCYVGGELVATHVAGGLAYDPAHYAEAMAPASGGSATPPATSRRPPRPTSACSTPIGGSL